MYIQHPKTLYTEIPKIAGLLLFVFIVLYSTNRASFLSQGVDFRVETIRDRQIVHESVLSLQGNAKRAQYIAINGREIVINEAGRFHETILLVPGPNDIWFDARDKFGEYTHQRFLIWYDNEEDSTTHLTTRWHNHVATKSEVSQTPEIANPEEEFETVEENNSPETPIEHASELLEQ